MNRLMVISFMVVVSALTSAYSKPVLLMGVNYGLYERQYWIKQILNEERIDFKSSDGWVPPSQWGDYCAVMIAEDSPYVPSNSADQAAISNYINNGGMLICMEHGLSSLLGLTSGIGPVPSWASPWVVSGTVGRVTSGTNYNVAAGGRFPWPDDAGTISALTNPSWGTYFYDLDFRDLAYQQDIVTIPTAQGTRGIVVLTQKQIGQPGYFLFVGRMLYRIATPGATETAAAADARCANLREAIRKTLLNLNPTRVQASNADQIRQNFQTTHEWLTWKRDPEADVELYAYSDVAKYPRFSPPWPKNDEQITSIELNVGTGEIHSHPFNIYPLSNLTNFTVTLSSGTSSAIPPGAVQIAFQDALAPVSGGTATMTREQEQFWLRPLSGNQAVSLKKSETGIFWIQVNSGSLPPGDYALNLQLNDGVTQEVIPVTLKVKNVLHEQADGMRLGLYGMYWLSRMPMGWQTLVSGTLQNVNYSSTALSPILNASWALGLQSADGTALDMNGVKIKKTGQTLKQFSDARKANPALDFFLIEDPAVPQVPKLDFTCYDNQLQMARNLGMYRMTIRHSAFTSSFTNPTGTNNDYIEMLTGEPFMPEDGTHVLGDKWKSAFQGIWSQFRWYVSDKGFTERYFKYGDEMSTQKIEQEWLPVERIVHAVSWAPEVNLTGEAVNVPLIKEIVDECRLFQLNENYVDQFLSSWHNRDFSISPYAKVTSYGSWGYHKSPGSYTRREWWETFGKNTDREKLAGIDIYTFALLQVFDGSNVYFSASSEGWRTGWVESGYLSKLKSLFDQNASNSDPQVIAWRAQVQDFFTNYIAPDSGSAPTSAYYHGMYWQVIDPPGSLPANRQLVANTEMLDLSRKDVLNLLVSYPLSLP